MDSNDEKQLLEATPGVAAGDLLEARVNGAWVRCPLWTWRSWTGPRRLNGEDWAGPVYFLGSETASRA